MVGVGGGGGGRGYNEADGVHEACTPFVSQLNIDWKHNSVTCQDKDSVIPPLSHG